MHCTPAANGYFVWPASAIAAVPPAERFSNKINARSGHWAGISRLDGIVGRKSLGLIGNGPAPKCSYMVEYRIAGAFSIRRLGRSRAVLYGD